MGEDMFIDNVSFFTSEQLSHLHNKMHSQLLDKAYLGNTDNGSIMIEFKFKK